MARVLVIDDAEDVAQVVDEALTDAGHDVTVAADADTGLRAYRERRPDVVVLDLILPGRSGLEPPTRIFAPFVLASPTSAAR